MVGMLPLTMVSVFVFSSLGFGSSFAPRCGTLLGEGQVKIDSLLQQQNPSRLKDNFKLTMAYLYQGLEHQYGPLTLKASTVKLDWNLLKVQGLISAGKAETSNEQYYAIANFMAKLNDAHVSVSLPSTLTYKIPLQFQAAEDRLHVGFISDKFPKNLREPSEGDELVGINGMTPEEFQKQFVLFNASGNELTNKTLFGLMMSKLSEESGFPLSNLKWKEFEFTFKSFKNPNETYTIKVPIETEGTGLIGKDMDGNDPNPEIIASPQLASGHDPSSDYAPKTTSIIRKALSLFRTETPAHIRDLGQKNLDIGKGQKMEIGGFDPFFRLPKNFKPIVIPPEVLADPKFSSFFSPKNFNAGTFVRNGQRVGFLRIPSYGADSVGAIATTIRYFIGKLEAQSDYLIIDQTNNPGGMVIMSDMLIKGLNGKYIPEKHMRFAVKPSQKFVRQFRELRDDIAKNEDKLFTNEEVKEFVAELDVEYRKVYKAFSEGKELSEPVSMLAISEYAERSFDKTLFKLPWGPVFEAMLGVNIQKHQTYTKDVYFMINELDFSGGDATPAILQDYGRAFLVGTHERTQTGGAGGTVENFSLRAAVEISLSWTTSLMVRFRGLLVENYGVKSDFNVPLKAQDIADGKTNYLNRILDNIDAHRAARKAAQN